MEVLARDLRGLPASAVARLREVYELDRDTQRLLAEVREEEKALLRDIRRANRANRDRERDREKEKNSERAPVASTSEGKDGKENNDNNDRDNNGIDDNHEEEAMNKCSATAAAVVCVSSESNSGDNSDNNIDDDNNSNNNNSGDINADAVCDNNNDNNDNIKTNDNNAGAALSAEDRAFHERLRRIHGKRSLAARRLDFQVAATQAFYDFLDSKVNYLAKATEPLQSIYPLDEEAFLAEQRKKKKKRKEEAAVEEQAVSLIDPNEPLYCFCKGVSYGNMVACENEDCPIEWFHFPCVGLTEAPTDPWYCPQCAPQFVKPPPA